MANNPTEENGQTSTPFIVGMGFIGVFVAIAAIWVVLNDKLNANDAYRQTEMRRQRDNAIQLCSENLSSLQEIQEWARQMSNSKPPTAGMKNKQCPTIESAEKPEEHK